ncbi:ABC transporter ATP-binding protein [Paenibacillus sp. SI8]|uniref:ABC transporter ATP-binding protein n=1 Tax=unclassified Paenibacillus TaxID=185978 RepID=UPI003464EDC0
MSFRQAFTDLWQLMSFIRPQRKMYVTGLIGESLVSSSLTILLSFVIQYLLNFAVSGNTEELSRAVWLVSGSVLGLSILSPLFNYLFLRSIKITLGDIRIQLYQHIGKLSYQVVERHHSGDLLSRMTNDVQTIEQTFNEHLKSIVSQMITFVGTIVVLCIVDWRFALVLIVLGILTVVLNTRFAAPMRDVSDKLQKQMSVLTERSGDLIAGLQVVKLFGLKSTIGRLCMKASDDVSEFGVKQGHQSGLLEAGNFLIQFLSMGGILVIGLYMVSRQEMELGVLGQIVHLQSGISHTFLQLGAVIALMQNSFAGAARIRELLEESTEGEYTAKTVAFVQHIPVHPHPAVELCSISFGYDPERPVLRNLTMTVEEGSVTAIVGPSGGGKSTIMKVLLGFYPQNDGELLIQGKNTEQYSLAEIREKIAYVPQEAFLFHGTIAENIRIGRQDATDEEVELATKAANAHSFISELPGSYNAVVGERGANLSGGQRQRIAIARALLKNSPILLLDEATSALDPESEHEVQQALQVLMKDRTTLVIAHRLITVEQADSICVIADGQLKEQGTHQELLAKDGLYAELYNLQFHSNPVKEPA